MHGSGLLALLLRTMVNVGYHGDISVWFVDWMMMMSIGAYEGENV